MRIIVVSLYCLISILGYSQKYGNAWIVGYSNDSTFIPKIGKTVLNFSTGKLEFEYTFGQRKPDLGFTNASLATIDGKLKYFTDGYNIYSGDQNVISNGDSINFGPIWVDYDVGGYPTEYNHVFLPMPGKESTETILLHFNLDYYDPPLTERFTITPNFKMSKIRWDTVTGRDAVLFKDSIILKGDFIQKHMACTRHANGRDWWIIIEDYLTNNHRMFLLDPTGIHLKSIQKIGIPADSSDWTGNSLFTPNGMQYIKYLRGYQIQIFDFDRCYGELSNPQVIINDKTSTSSVNSYLEVSSNNRFLYLNSDSIIWQYDLFANDIKGSETIIGVWDGYYFMGQLNTDFHQMSLGTDGKIYVSCRSSTNLGHVINNPNEKGSNCNFQLRGLEIPAYMFGNFPKLPNFKLGALIGSTCDTIITSVKNESALHDNHVLVYPSETSSYISVKSINGKINSKIRIKLIDISGRILFSNEYENLNNEIHIPLFEYVEGLYLIDIKDNNGNHWLKKFIKL